MAVWVYKDDESVLIQPQALQRHLDAGWSVTKEEKKRSKTKKKKVNEEEVQQELIDTPDE